MKREPQYIKIKKYIVKNIDEGKYKENEKIESEHELCDIFGVTRMTVRQALSELVNDNIIYSVPKIGSFVAKKSKFKNFNGLNSFSEDSSRKQGKATSIIIYSSKEKASKEVALEMGIKENDNVWHLTRVRSTKGETVAYEDDYINYDLVGDIPNEVAETSLFKYFEDTKGYEIAYSDQQMDAIIAGKDIAKYLEIKPNDPLLRVLSVTRLNNGKCIEYGHTYYRCDRYTFNQVAYRKK
ncbi:MAG: GntR family transcriptional regulator [Thomasclavelia sp.]|jgi:DNA-binding GntR family transcriptional regulator|nr:GntR family transcriptional regulator [Thomasclavelia sp.]